ncbi:hypothetical protein Lsan_2743 [Legionella santicrucis]|uniref:Uncharacterized protein n=1 Tax=Legionella santicrucis TaxID=45074 RepID=A0A0W0YIC3_9GAMM|nr:hypothetical protein [Legionella santicrucis]KTD56583.1 hypothetical protein Lsan_2743 [Legionella santicrucis]
MDPNTLHKKSIPELKALLFQRNDKNEISAILKAVIKRILEGNSQVWELRNLIGAFPNENLILNTKGLLPLKDDCIEIRKLFFRELCRSFGSNPNYRSGEPDGSNASYKGFVNDLGKIRGNLGEFPELEDRVIDQFVLAHFTTGNSAIAERIAPFMEIFFDRNFRSDLTPCSITLERLRSRYNEINPSVGSYNYRS